MKIVYCINSLSSGGGTARIVSLKASYFADKMECEVWILVSSCFQNNYSYPLSNKVKVIFMGELLANTRNILPGINFIMSVSKARKIYYEILDTIKPDLVSVTGPFIEDFVIPSIAKQLNIRTLREFHFARKALDSLVSNTTGILSRVKMKIQFKMTLSKFNSYDMVVLLTNKDRADSNYTTQVSVISNTSSLGCFELEPFYQNKRVISVGSMRSNVKRFDLQIKLWVRISKEHPDWSLHIYGDGQLFYELKRLIEQLNLSHSVFLHGSSSQIMDEYLNSSFYLSTSCAEGFPMTFLEAMEAGLPIVSFDCPCGPSDLIDNGVNGYLVEDGDIEDLYLKVSELILDSEKLKRFGANSKIKYSKYTDDVIFGSWVELYRKLLNYD